MSQYSETSTSFFNQTFQLIFKGIKRTMAPKEPTSKSIASSVVVVDEIELETHGDQLDDFYIDPQAERRLLRKLDWRLIPWLSLLYLMSFLDRTSIGNAKIQGLNFIMCIFCI